MRRLVILVALALGACGSASEVSREVGARCDMQSECDERCLSGVDYPGGFCSVACDDDDDCPGGASCVDLEGGVCLFTCVELVDCEFLGTGWQCRDEQGHPGGEDVKVCRGDG